ncbi:MAG: hypothetical protein AAF363_15715 [Bacteroidota bacterium]
MKPTTKRTTSKAKEVAVGIGGTGLAVAGYKFLGSKVPANIPAFVLPTVMTLAGLVALASTSNNLVKNGAFGFSIASGLLTANQFTTGTGAAQFIPTLSGAGDEGVPMALPSSNEEQIKGALEAGFDDLGSTGSMDAARMFDGI